MNADIILLDDKLARNMASGFGLKILGTVGILIWAKKTGLIDLFGTELDTLLTKANFRLSQDLIRMALREVGEN